MTFSRRSIVSMAAGAVLGAGAFVAPALADDFPSGPIEVIVPFGAGGGFDTMVRALQPGLEEELGVPLAIVNRPGAGGRLGSIEVYRSDPDGYTIGLSYFLPFLTDLHILNEEIPVDLQEYAVLYRTTHDSHYLYVAADGPYQTFEDFANADRPVRVATTGIGSSAWIGTEVLKSMLGFEVVYVPGYSTLNEAALAVARGDADASFGAVPHFGGLGDDIRPLAYLGAERDWQNPDVPTAAEMGFPDTTLLGGVHIFSAPPGTPEARQEVLREAFRKAVDTDRFREWAHGNSTLVSPGEPDEVYQYARDLGALFDSLDIQVD